MRAAVRASRTLLPYPDAPAPFLLRDLCAPDSVHSVLNLYSSRRDSAFSASLRYPSSSRVQTASRSQRLRLHHFRGTHREPVAKMYVGGSVVIESGVLVSAGSGAASFGGAGFRFCGFFFSILRRRGRLQRTQKPHRYAGHFIDRRQKHPFVRLRRLVEAADFSHKLQRRRPHLFLSNRRSKAEKRLDISAHGAHLLGSILSSSLSALSFQFSDSRLF